MKEAEIIKGGKKRRKRTGRMEMERKREENSKEGRKIKKE